MPRNIFVLIIAKTSNAFETFADKICIKEKTTITKIVNISKEKIPAALVIIKNQKVKPDETVNALNLGEDSFILDRINQSY